MLKVTIVDGRTEQRFVVEGKLTGRWASELELAWQHARDSCQGREVVVDLSETTVIDESGRTLLVAMVREGARLIAKGVYTEYVVKSLVDKARHDGLDPATPSPAAGPWSILGSAERLSSENPSDRGTTKLRR